LEVITTIMTSPYHFYFIFVPREISNLSEVKFGEVAVLKQILVLHYKNSWKFSEYLFNLLFLVHMPLVISKLSLVLHFSIWAIEGPRKNQPYLLFCFDRFLPLFVFASRSLSFWVLLITELLGKLLQEYMLYMWCFWVETWTKKGWFIIMLMLTLLIELCWVLYEGSFPV
jgi:hypothetical protein